MKQLILPDGTSVPKLGQGTWHMGDDLRKREAEKEALRTGVACGMNLIDSAEMYGNGKSEELIGEVVRDYDRDALFLVSKVYPHNAGRANIFDSCEASIRRMNAQYLDLYLLHWRGSVPLSETVECMEELVQRGLIRRWGVSNFDTEDMEELFRVEKGERCSVNQVLYHLGSRGVEFDLLPWLQRHNVPLMAYCPTAQAGSLRRGLLEIKKVLDVAKAHSATPVQVLLAFLSGKENVFAVPKAGRAEHVLENAGAVELVLTQEELRLLDEAYPPPNRKTYLDIV